MYSFLIALVSLALIALIFRKRYLIMMRGTSSSSPEEEGVLPVPEESDLPPAIIPSKATDSFDFSEVNRIFRVGDMHFFRGDLVEAEKCFIKVLSLYEHHHEATNRLGVIYIQQKQPYKAELLYKRLLLQNNREPVYYSNYGRCLYNQKKYDQAVASYEVAIKLDSRRAARFVSLGQILYERGKYAQALDLFLRAHKLEPKNKDYLILVADLYEIFNDKHNLEIFLRKVLDIDPYNKIVTAKLEKLTGEKAEIKPVETDESQMELL